MLGMQCMHESYIILYVYYGRIWRFGCGLADQHLNRKQKTEWFIILHYPRDKNRKIRLNSSLLSHGYFLKYSHLAIPALSQGWPD